MAKEDYIQTNVILLCDKGTFPTPFVATPKKQNHHGITGGTIRDNLPLLNIFPFGVCTVTKYPCVPVMPIWEDYPESPWFIEGFQPLLMSSCAKCQLGGTINIYPSLLAASAALGGNLKSWKDKLLAVIDRGIGRALLGPAASILEMCGHGDIVSGAGEFGRGFVAGFAKGLAGTVEGLYNMVAHPLDTLGGMAQLAGVAVVGYSSPIPGVSAEARLKKFDSVFGTNLADVDAGIKQSLSDMGDQFVHGTNEERGEVVGQAVEFVAEFFVGTKGAGAALKSVKAGSMGGKMAKAANIADKVADIVKATGSKLKNKTLGKLKDVFKGIFRKKNIARKATNEESLMIQKLKEKYHLPNGKNIAKFEGEIDGKKIDMISISGKKSPAGTVKSVNFENQKLSTKATKLDKKLNRKNLDVRAYDSEVKGLENILSKTTSESEGTIKIVSDRNMCTSCSDAITQFEQMRPNIKVEKVYVREYP